jgi:hypothetical protein
MLAHDVVPALSRVRKMKALYLHEIFALYIRLRCSRAVLRAHNKDVFRVEAKEVADKEVPRLVVPFGVFRMDTLRTRAGTCPAVELAGGKIAAQPTSLICFPN